MKQALICSFRSFRRSRTSLAVIGLACACSGAAWAQSSPYYVGITQRFTHEDNLYNSPVAPVSDTSSATTLRAGLNQPIGRQRVFAELSGTSSRYSDNSNLNNNGYSARAGLDWETVGRLSGTLAASANQSLAEFSPAGFAASTSKNITKTRDVNAIVRLGVVTRLTGELSLAHRSTQYSSAARAAGDNDVDEMSIGVRYRPGATLTLGAALRMANGDYPRYFEPQPGQFVGEGYERRYLDLTADWPLSGASSLSGRLSVGKESFDTVKVRDFSGVTGSIGWRWQPTGKVSLSTNLSRDAGDQSALFFGVPGGTPSGTPSGTLIEKPSIVTINQVRTALNLSAAYELTAKIKLSAGASMSDGRSVNPAANTVGDDRSNTVQLGVTWAPTRSITTGCDFSRTSRSASTVASGYDANKTGCYGEFTLR